MGVTGNWLTIFICKKGDIYGVEVYTRDREGGKYDDFKVKRSLAITEQDIMCPKKMRKSDITTWEFYLQNSQSWWC